MALKDYFTLKGIASLIDKVRIGGLTIASHLKENRANTKTSFKSLFKQAVMGELPAATLADQASKLVSTRKRQTLNTLRNVMSSVRGWSRSVAAGRSKGTWHNVGVLDSNTTETCLSFRGRSWPQPYSAIENKPPRVPPPHPCRSHLVFRFDGDAPPDETPFMDSFSNDDDLQRDLLGPTRYDAMKRGDLKINSFAEYEKTVLTTLDDLGLK